METKILIGFRPRTNNYYTAKKITVLSILNTPFDDNILESFSEEEWSIVDTDKLSELADVVIKVIKEEINVDPSIPCEFSESNDNDMIWKTAINYVWSKRNVEAVKDHIEKISDHIVVYETLNMAKNMYKINNAIEIVIRKYQI